MAAFRLSPYGRRELAACATTATAACAAIALGAWWLGWWLLGLLALPLGLWAGVLWFFRDPLRQPPGGRGVLVSPADGRVTDITPVGADGPLGAEGVKVGIFMSILDVHVNRCPEAATVVRVDHHDGAFLDARRAEAPERNESADILMTTAGGHPLVVRQVAGRIARRIVTDLAEGQPLARGQRIGMIKFGSRVELLVPRDLVGRVCVSVGQRVLAGRTVLIASTQTGQDDPHPTD